MYIHFIKQTDVYTLQYFLFYFTTYYTICYFYLKTYKNKINKEHKTDYKLIKLNGLMREPVRKKLLNKQLMISI